MIHLLSLLTCRTDMQQHPCAMCTSQSCKLARRWGINRLDYVNSMLVGCTNWTNLECCSTTGLQFSILTLISNAIISVHWLNEYSIRLWSSSNVFDYLLVAELFRLLPLEPGMCCLTVLFIIICRLIPTSAEKFSVPAILLLLAL